MSSDICGLASRGGGSEVRQLQITVAGRRGAYSRRSGYRVVAGRVNGRYPRKNKS